MRLGGANQRIELQMDGRGCFKRYNYGSQHYIIILENDGGAC